MCDHSPNREAAMVTVKEGIWCDPCLAPLVKALNEGDLTTVTSQKFGVELATTASCCGHGMWTGWIMLADGRVLILAPDLETSKRMMAAVDAEDEAA